MNKKLALACSLLVACLGFLVPLPAKAASLQLVTADWGTNGVPTNVVMYIYVPDHLAPNPPILVLLHYWGGGASGVFAEAQGGGIVAAADQYGFIMVVPQNPDCWDAGSAKSLTHDGGGQTEAIAHMVNYTITNYQANKARVYVTGTSCGGMMTETMLAVYPDIFKAGASFSGQAVGGAWTPVTHTAQQWGDIVRAAYPGYTGRRPRVQLWHGTADTIINYTNQVESISQWGNVLGLSTNPTTTATVTILNITNQWVHQTWQDACGDTVLDAWSEMNGPHGTDANLNAKYVIPFLGLDKTGPVDPVPPCGGAVSAYSQIEAENYDTEWSGIRIESCNEGGQDIGTIQNGSYVVFQNMDFGGGAASFQARVASTNGGNIDLHLDSLPGMQVGTCVVTNTGGGQSWVTQSCPIGGAVGVHDLYLKFTGGTGSLFNINWWRFSTGGQGLGAAPAGLVATAASDTQINLAWNASTNAASYNVKRSITSSGPYTIIASGVTSTNYQDGALTGGSLYYYYVVSAVVGGSETPNSAEAAVRIPHLTGAIIGTAGSWNNSGNTITNVFDNSLNTFFDGPVGNGCWAGLDFGIGVSNVITQINYCPRSGFESRMVGGIFQGANWADFSDAVPLFTVGTQPTAGVFTPASISNTAAFRYVRYLSPNSGWGNVSELEFYGYRFSILLGTNNPRIGVALTGTNLTMLWPVASASFALQSRTNLLLGDWVNVTSPAPQIVSGQWQIILPLSGNADSTFYRLVK